MITVFEEVPGSIKIKDAGASGDGDSLTCEYKAHSNASTIDDQLTDISSWITANMPAVRLGMPLAEVKTEETLATGWWDVEVEYSVSSKRDNDKNDVKNENESSFSFEIATTTTKIRMSEELLEKKGPAPGVIGYPGVLGFDGKKVNGLDILVPEASWEETYFFAPAYVTQAQRLVWLSLVGKINGSTFKGAAAGECLLASITGKKNGVEPWEISFKFLYSPTRANLEFRTFNEGAYQSHTFTSVGGWDVFDFIYQEGVDANELVIWPKCISRHRVYPYGDFSLLGIG